MRALVVRPVFRNLLQARAQTGDRNNHFHGENVLALANLASEGHLVVHQALDPGHRRRFVDEVRKGHFDMSEVGLQPPDHVAQHRLEGFHRDFAFVRVQDLDKTRHVSALEVVREAHVHIERGDGVLHAVAPIRHPYRMTNGLDSNLVDGQPAVVRRTLYVGNRKAFGEIHDWFPWWEYIDYRRRQ